MRRLHRDGHVPKVRIAVSGPLHRHAFPPSDAHEPLQVPRKAVRAGSPADVLRGELGAALSQLGWAAFIAFAVGPISAHEEVAKSIRCEY